MKIEHFENRAGGKGWIHIEHLLEPEQLGSKVRMYARVTIDPQASIGYHTHQGDGESYYIVSGSGRYQSEEGCYTVQSGDHLWTGDGHSHGIENTGSTPLVILAMILVSDPTANSK